MTQVYTCELQSLFGSKNVIRAAISAVDTCMKWVWTVWVCLYVDFFNIENIHVEHHMHDFVEVDNLSLHRYMWVILNMKTTC